MCYLAAVKLEQRVRVEVTEWQGEEEEEEEEPPGARLPLLSPLQRSPTGSNTAHNRRH